LVSIEGMASGKPFLASNVEGLTDIVSNAGLLFESKDEQKLSQLILDLINDKELYSEISERCLNKASQFDINIVVNKQIKLYDSFKNEGIKEGLYD
jgi:glycosyltransferase involved in cell wall biosynthesis